MSNQDEELDRSHAAITQAARARQHSSIVEMTLVAIAALLISVSTAFSAWNTFELRKLQQAQIDERNLILQGTKCLVEQMAEHRHLNASAHRANASTHGFSYPIPLDEEPPPVPGALKEACDIFVANTTTTVSKP